MKEQRILIIGYGVVGNNMHKLFPEADIQDSRQGHECDPSHKYNVAFVCVPTPSRADGSCDTRIVGRTITEVQAHVFCIKSTVAPGTTDGLVDNLPDKCIVFSPEYWGETVHANGYDYPYVILGGLRHWTEQVAEIYKRKHTGEFRIIQTTAVAAELAKYMENAFLATKVTFCNEFYRLACRLGVDYNELRELWLQDPRMGRSHTFVYRDQPYYDSKCLNKDLPAIIRLAEDLGYEPELLKAVVKINRHWKEETGECFNPVYREMMESGDV